MNQCSFVYIGLRGYIITILKYGKRKDGIRKAWLEVLKEKKYVKYKEKKPSNIQIQNCYKINIYPKI